MRFEEKLSKIFMKVKNEARRFTSRLKRVGVRLVNFLKPTVKEIAYDIRDVATDKLKEEGERLVAEILPIVKEQVTKVALEGKKGDEAFKEVYEYVKGILLTSGRVVATSLIKFAIELAYNTIKGRL